MPNFYDQLHLFKKRHKINNEELGKVVDKSMDAFRMALSRKSLTPLEVKALTEFMTDRDQLTKLEEEVSKYQVTDKKKLLKIAVQFVENYQQLKDFEIVKNLIEIEVYKKLNETS